MTAYPIHRWYCEIRINREPFSKVLFLYEFILETHDEYLQFLHTSPFYAKIFSKNFSALRIIHLFNFCTDEKQPACLLGCLTICRICSVTFSPTGDVLLRFWVRQSDSFIRKSICMYLKSLEFHIHEIGTNADVSR